MDQISDLATFISQAQGQLSRLTGTLDATGGAAEAGLKSASAFLRTPVRPGAGTGRGGGGHGPRVAGPGGHGEGLQAGAISSIRRR